MCDVIDQKLEADTGRSTEQGKSLATLNIMWQHTYMSYSFSYNKPEVNVCLYFQTSGKSLCVFILPTYTDGRPPETAAWFCKWLEEASNDFRVEKELLKGMKFAVFGLGNSQYKEHFNEVGQLHHLIIMECSN